MKPPGLTVETSPREVITSPAFETQEFKDSALDKELVRRYRSQTDLGDAREAPREEMEHMRSLSESHLVFHGDFPSNKTGGGGVLRDVRYIYVYIVNIIVGVADYKMLSCKKSKSTIINHLVEEFSVPLIWRHHHVVSKVVFLFPPV